MVAIIRGLHAKCVYYRCGSWQERLASEQRRCIRLEDSARLACGLTANDATTSLRPGRPAEDLTGHDQHSENETAYANCVLCSAQRQEASDRSQQARWQDIRLNILAGFTRRLRMQLQALRNTAVIRETSLTNPAAEVATQ